MRPSKTAAADDLLDCHDIPCFQSSVEPKHLFIDDYITMYEVLMMFELTTENLCTRVVLPLVTKRRSRQVSPTKKTVLYLPCVLAVISLSACFDDEGVSSVSSRPQWTVETLPADSIFEDEPMLEVARQLPSFGGFYFNDQDQIVVALTDVNDLARAQSIIEPMLGVHRPKGYLSKKVDYSFLELARYRTVLRQYVFGIDGVATLGVNESDNRVKIGIANLLVLPRLLELLIEHNIPAAAVIFPEVRVPSFRSDSLRGVNPSGTVQGGWQIQNASLEVCSVGFPARRASNGAAVFVTASHCTTTVHGYDGGALKQPWYNSSYQTIGVELLDPPTWTCGFPSDDCRHSDAALISAGVPIELGVIARTTTSSGCEDCEAGVIIDATYPKLRITSRYNHVFQNETLHKIGRRSGWTYGSVEDTCDDIETGGWVQQCSDRVDFALLGTDSGSPVFYYNGNGTVELRGIAFASAPDWDFIWADAWISDLNQIEKDLGALIVHGVNASIGGSTSVPEDALCSWTAEFDGGRAPYSITWQRDWPVVGTGETYTANTGFSSFSLTLTVTDADNNTAQDAVYVSVGGGSCF